MSAEIFKSSGVSSGHANWWASCSLSTDLISDTIERVDVSATTHETLEDDDHKYDPDIRNEFVVDLKNEYDEIHKLSKRRK